jgi:hypothetical protein
MRAFAILGVVYALSAGCVVGAVASDPDAATLADVDGYRTMQRIDTRPFASAIAPVDVNCYAAGDVATYREIHPEQPGSGVHVAVGTVIVREVLDGSGNVAKLTVMAKQAAGYDPSLGDWWFGVTDPHGLPLRDDNGQPMLGRLTECHGCHAPRAADDFLFGVSAFVE